MPVGFSPPFDLPLPPCPDLPSRLPFPFPWPFPPGAGGGGGAFWRVFVLNLGLGNTLDRLLQAKTEPICFSARDWGFGACTCHQCQESFGERDPEPNPAPEPEALPFQSRGCSLWLLAVGVCGGACAVHRADRTRYCRLLLNAFEKVQLINGVPGGRTAASSPPGTAMLRTIDTMCLSFIRVAQGMERNADNIHLVPQCTSRHVFKGHSAAAQRTRVQRLRVEVWPYLVVYSGTKCDGHMGERGQNVGGRTEWDGSEQTCH